MHIKYSCLITSGIHQGTFSTVVPEVDGKRVSLDELTPELLQQILSDADIVTIFGDEGDRQSEITELAEVFFTTISAHTDWTDGETAPFMKGIGATIRKTKSTTIRGKDNINSLIDKFSILLSPIKKGK